MYLYQPKIKSSAIRVKMLNINDKDELRIFDIINICTKMAHYCFKMIQFFYLAIYFFTMEKRKEKILIIDDDPAILIATRIVLKKKFQNIYISGDPRNIHESMVPGQYDIILLDMNFKAGARSGREGLKWIELFKKTDRELLIISITAYGDIEIAVEAMKAGASDFISKPWENERILTSVLNAADLKKSRDQVKKMSERERYIVQKSNENVSPVIGSSRVIREILKMIGKVAPTDANVLILGENGTGKELFAREIHRLSERKKAVFIPVDLGSIAESLFESELFGHVRGAFTDAKTERQGWFEIAEKGTLFLDEIANIPSQLQQKLLSVLQNRKVSPVGSELMRDIDIRLISATNADITDRIRNGLFREDLFYRINTVEIVVPPLRERTVDIPLIAEHYLHHYSRKYHKQIDEISPSAYEKLMEYNWPGNVRELIHIIERAVILSDDNKLNPSDFPLRQIVNSVVPTVNLNELEQRAIKSALHKHRNNYTRASKELGMGRSTLYRKIRKYGI